MPDYDEQLIADCIAHYRALDGRILTPEEAERYLDSLADWYDWLVDQVQRGFPSSSFPGKSSERR